MRGFDKRFGERSSVPQARSRPRRGMQQQVEIVGGVSSDDCMIHAQFESNLMWPREVRFAPWRLTRSPRFDAAGAASRSSVLDEACEHNLLWAEPLVRAR